MKNLAYYRDLSDRDNNFRVVDRPLQVNCTGRAVYGHKAAANTVRKDYYLLYLLQGEIALTLPLTGELHPGDMILFAPDIPFAYHAVSEGTLIYLWVHFSGTQAGNLLERCHIPVGTLCSPGLGEELRQRFLLLFPAFVRRDEFCELDAAIQLSDILLGFGRALRGKEERSGVTDTGGIYRSTAYIHEHLAGDLSVEELAARAFMSEGHYRSLFRKVMGISPMEYIIDHRMRQACNLLGSTNAPIHEIAAAVGYTDSHYFARLFTKKMGITPSAYRKSRR